MEKLHQIKENLLASPKEKLLCVSTTANVTNPKVYIGPMRETPTTLSGNVIVRDDTLFDILIEIFDGVVDYFLLDCEVKNELTNLETVFRPKIKKSRSFVYKPNDFTVESLDVLLATLFSTLQHKKILVVGAGNIGSKIALKLCERGAHVFLRDTDLNKCQAIAAGLNSIKRNTSTITLATPGETNYTVILGCTPGIPVIDQSLVNALLPDGKIIDVGIGTITPDGASAAKEHAIEILSLSSMGGYRGLIENWLWQRTFVTQRRVRAFGSVRLIVPGVFGNRGDILVDNVDTPQHIIGICNGAGNVLAKGNRDPLFYDLLTTVDDQKLAIRLKQLYQVL